MPTDNTRKARTAISLRPNKRVVQTASASKRAVVVTGVLFSCLTLLFIALFVRVVQLQVHPAEQVAARTHIQTTQHTLPARRGAILDRRGRELAVSHLTNRLFVDPQLIQDRGVFSVQVAHHLDYDPVQIEMQLNERPFSRYVVIDPAMDEQRSHRLREVRLPGLASHPTMVRNYPYGTLAGQIIGFVGSDGDGLEGVERFWENRLRGHNGSMRFIRDAKRRPLWTEDHSYHPPVDGRRIKLSIDATIQAIAEHHLAQTVEHFKAEAGQIVIMDPYTGEILAMANYPFFGPDDYRNSQADHRRNRAVTDVFEPGSIFKPIIWAALAEMGAAKPDEKFDTTTAGVKRLPFGRRLRDATPQGLITWDTVLMKSSNIGMAEAALRVSHDDLRSVLDRYGFGHPTTSGLPGEVGGQVTPKHRWNNYSQTSVPMGQEISVTALQMVRAFCSIANDGLLVSPTIEAVDMQYNHLTPVTRRVLKPDIARHTRYVLRQAMTEGTGRRADSKLYPIFGKTGTAQLPDLVNGGYHEDQYVSSFLAGAPVDNPKLVIGCFIHRPDRSIGHFGGIVAAPTAMRVLEESLVYLGVPTLPDVKPEDVQVVVDRLIGNTPMP